MKKTMRLLLAAAFAAGLLGVGFLPAPEAGALKPRCGGQRDGTWSEGTMTCGGAASNCTEVTVCG